jgi:4'-phosphopantetheinyl transferase
MKLIYPETYSWLRPVGQITLLKNDVHVWRASLDDCSGALKEYARILSDAEHKKAERFRFDRDKIRFIIGRGVLRTIIGKYYIGVEPNHFEFSYGSHGKPHLVEKLDGRALYFNQADSNGLALYAFTQISEIGVDLEYMRSMADEDQIVEGSLSEYEKDAFKALSESEKHEAFFSCWTRKEAFIKAIGKGLYYPLDQFDVSLCPDEPARVISIEGDQDEASKWTLIDLRPEIGYAAAVAFEGTFADVRLWVFC